MKKILLLFILQSTAFGANNFYDAVALWKFDNGALTTDSIGTNTLTSNGTPTADTSVYKEGDASVDMASGSSEYFDITDAGLDSGFPYKSGETNRDMTICFWVRFDATGSAEMFVGKYDFTGPVSDRSFFIAKTSGDVIELKHGYNAGANGESAFHLSSLSATTWYHIGVTLDSSENYRIRIHDESSLVGSDFTGTFGNATSITTAVFNIGAYDDPGTLFNDSKMDEVVVFDKELTTSEIDAVWNGTYGNIPIIMYNQRRHR